MEFSDLDERRFAKKKLKKIIVLTNCNNNPTMMTLCKKIIWWWNYFFNYFLLPADVYWQKTFFLSLLFNYLQLNYFNYSLYFGSFNLNLVFFFLCKRQKNNYDNLSTNELLKFRWKMEIVTTWFSLRVLIWGRCLICKYLCYPDGNYTIQYSEFFGIISPTCRVLGNP